jgi:hypothetical protein
VFVFNRWVAQKAPLTPKGLPPALTDGLIPSFTVVVPYMNWNTPFHSAQPLVMDRRNDAKAFSNLDTMENHEILECDLPAFPIGQTAGIDLGVPRIFVADVRYSLSWNK